MVENLLTSAYTCKKLDVFNLDYEPHESKQEYDKEKFETITPISFTFTGTTLTQLLQFREIFKPELEKDLENNLQNYLELPESVHGLQTMISELEKPISQMELPVSERSSLFPDSDDSDADLDDLIPDDDEMKILDYQSIYADSNHLGCYDPNKNSTAKIDLKVKENEIVLSKNFDPIPSIYYDQSFAQDFSFDLWQNLKDASDHYQRVHLLSKKGVNMAPKPDRKKLEEAEKLAKNVESSLKSFLPELRDELRALEKMGEGRDPKLFDDVAELLEVTGAKPLDF